MRFYYLESMEYSDLIQQLHDLMRKSNQSFFVKRLKHVLQFYKDIQEEIVFRHEESVFKINKVYYNNHIDRNVEYCIQVIEKYLLGDIKGSIGILEKAIRPESERNNLRYYRIEVGKIYYRVRSHKRFDHLKAIDLFHLPYHLREMSSTARYSIPGYPCLYLGSSLYVCWEELRKKSLCEYTAVGIKCKKSVSLLDLRLERNFFSKRDCIAYLIFLPFIIACSMQVNNDDYSFKPEYILPQLILHLVLLNHPRNINRQDDENNAQTIKTKQYRGIIYTSSIKNTDYKNLSSNPEKNSCIVLPAVTKNIQENGWSESLSTMIEISNPYTFDESAYLQDINNFHSNILKSNDIAIEELEMNAYNPSYFYAVEKLIEGSQFTLAKDLTIQEQKEDNQITNIQGIYN